MPKSPKTKTTKRDAATRTWQQQQQRGIKRIESRYRAMLAEQAQLTVEGGMAERRLVRNQDRRGHTLTPRGRKALLSRFEHAIMRSTIVIMEQKNLFETLGIKRSNLAFLREKERA